MQNYGSEKAEVVHLRWTTRSGDRMGEMNKYFEKQEKNRNQKCFPELKRYKTSFFLAFNKQIYVYVYAEKFYQANTVSVACFE